MLMNGAMTNSALGKLATLLEMIKFSHTVFAFPFAQLMHAYERMRSWAFHNALPCDGFQQVPLGSGQSFPVRIEYKFLLLH